MVDIELTLWFDRGQRKMFWKLEVNRFLGAVAGLKELKGLKG